MTPLDGYELSPTGLLLPKAGPDHDLQADEPLLALPPGAYRPLSTRDRESCQRVMMRGASWMVAHKLQVHYTQDAVARWEAIRRNLRIAEGEFMTRGDCSSTYTWLGMNGLTHVHHHADVFNGLSYRGGYTGTLIVHGVRVDSTAHLRIGDAVFYGWQSRGVPEHVAMYAGNGSVFTHGSERGPNRASLWYRTDIVAFRRYF